MRRSADTGACTGRKVLGAIMLGLVAGSTPAAADALRLEPAEATRNDPVRHYDIAPGPLGDTLNRVARRAGVVFTFEPSLVSGKRSTGVRGDLSVRDAFSAALQGSGLEIRVDEAGGYTLRKAPVQPLPALGDDTSSVHRLKEIQVRAKRFHEIGPLPGLGLTKEEIPGNVQSLTAEDIRNAHSVSIADLLNSTMQSVNVNDYQGNPFQMDVNYRGFTASPQLGTPQGLSVFIDGIRVNEPFGDVVNWDMIPMNALSGFDVFPGSNPIFGLGTLGGAFSMRTKSGFDSPGVDAELLTGAFGRNQLQVSGGWNNGSAGLFGAGNFFVEDGWRDNSPSKVNQVFGKGSYRSDRLDLNLSSLYVWNDLVGNGLIPGQMYAQDRNGVFTSPDTTKNRLLQLQLSGSFIVNDNFTITGQVYRRNSDRRALGADVYTEHRGDYARRKLDPGEEYTCLYNSTNKYGLPDYYVVAFDPNDWFSPAYPEFLDFLMDYVNNGVADPSLLPAGAFNADLPDDYAAHAISEFTIWKNYHQYLFYGPQASGFTTVNPGETTAYSNGEPAYYNAVWVGGSAPRVPAGDVDVLGGMTGNFFYTPDGVKHAVMVINPLNGDKCAASQTRDVTSEKGELTQRDPVTGGVLVTDGFGTTRPGVVEGVPTAVLTRTRIEQLVLGASMQLNWNLDRHKFMVGASIDSAKASYGSGQMLGLLDAERNAYLAPDEILDQYAAADEEVRNNDFAGTSITKSLYASETWSPVETVHLTGAVRFNHTRVRNVLASRSHGFTVFDLSQYEAYPNFYDICIDGVCPATGYRVPDLARVVNPAETEAFTYRSLNPSVGGTWQARPDLNIYGNWARGARTPSVIELGCALDRTPVSMGGNKYIEKGLLENRSCSLPSTLSGDPYLPQIRAETIDFGMRGSWGENIEWNLGAYRTNLKDDIYLVTYPGNRSFFDSIGDTRRQGIEAGISARLGKARVRLNYALTDATFQDTFIMASNDNSSATLEPYCNASGQCIYDRDEPVGRIRVKPGNRMPGIPLHNLNATLSYDVTDRWTVGLTAIAHSTAYVRGNENNEHREGVVRQVPVNTYNGSGVITGTQMVSLQPTGNKGSVPGHVVFNFQTSYKLTPEWTFGMRINNVLDKEYFSAGRLGVNPFSPSIHGAIGPDGFNHNSSDWLSANFLAPGARRGIWLSLSYQFDPR
jgi:outer membrane receptor protein involved in Fe transport